MKGYKSLLLLFLCAVCAVSCMVAQTAAKPTIMVVPDKNWCIQNHYTTADGTPDYRKALGDRDLSGAMAAMGNIMAQRHYPLVDLETSLDQIDNESAINATHLSKGDGYAEEDDLSRMTRVANADILINLAMDSKPYGPRSITEFLVKATDAASAKVVFGKTGTSSASNAPVATLLNEAVMSFMDEFCSNLGIYFEAMERDGRECQIIFQIADDSPINFESEVSINGGSGELGEYIDYWISENCVRGAYSANGKTRTRLAFNQVKVPLFGLAKAGGFGSHKGKVNSLNAEKFVKPIEKDLRQFGCSVSTTPVGVGLVYVLIGGL
jgi:hypothetical protein